MKDELRMFEEEHAQAPLAPTEPAMAGNSEGPMSSGTLTTASTAASRSAVSSQTLSSSSAGPGNNSGRLRGSDEEVPNVHVTLAAAEPSQVWPRSMQCLSVLFS